MKTVKNDSNLKRHVSDWLAPWDMSFYNVDFEELVSGVSESISEDYELGEDINADEIDLIEYTKPFEKSPLERLFEKQFNTTYSEESLCGLGYRVNISDETISKWYDEDECYLFHAHLNGSDSYKGQAMSHILKDNLGEKFGEEIEKFL